MIDASDSSNILLKLAADPACEREAGREHRQWFALQLAGVKGTPCKLRFLNAGEATAAADFAGYQACVASEIDTEEWVRAETRYDGRELVVLLTPSTDTVVVAYFGLYTWARHERLIRRCLNESSAPVEVSSLGKTLDGAPLDLVRFGIPAAGKKTLWITARQHPSETMAEWAAEGLIERLLSPDGDPDVTTLLQESVLYVVPNANPDGSKRGHSRTNAVGANLNREWAEPSMEASPEVIQILEAMQSTGVDFLLDIHGDEGLPFAVMCCAPAWTERLKRLQLDFYTRLAKINPDFSYEGSLPHLLPTLHGANSEENCGDRMDRMATQGANLSLCSTQVGYRFDCLAMTLEQLYKDVQGNPDEKSGYSPARAKRMGRDIVSVLVPMGSKLR